MNKFMKNLILKNTGVKIPIVEKIKIENFNFSSEIIPALNLYECVYVAKLNYETTINAPYKLTEIEEISIKEKLAKNISWKLYGDALFLIDSLNNALNYNDIELCKEIVFYLRKEISGV